MVRIPTDLGGLNVRVTLLLILAGWGIFLLATAVFFLARYLTGILDEKEVLGWQRNWERKHGHRRPIKDLATVYLRNAKRIHIASLPLGGSVIAALVFILLGLSGVIATEPRILWAVAVVDAGYLLPLYLSCRVFGRGLCSVGEKILLLANRLERDTAEQA